MTSRRRRNRSRSPLRESPQHGGHRGYRQRDHHGGGDRHNNNRNGRDNSQSPFDDASREHGIPDFFYDDPPIEAERSTRRTSDRGRGHHQRGRDRDRDPRRDRPQSSNSRRNPMPPPAARQSRANEDKTASKKDRTKTMPQENRDKCGACKQNHDIRYCPYPNTDDGRTKICPICNTSNHAWFECWYYKRDVMEQWNVCWANRRCLPTLVHDAPLDEILHSRIGLARERGNNDGPSPLENFNKLPGPLSPAFVKKLMPIDRKDAHITLEVQNGRIVPWELKREALEDNEARTTSTIRDKSTMDMRIDRFIAGTRSSAESIPAASKQPFFNNIDIVFEANQIAYKLIRGKKPLPSVKAIKPTRTYPRGKWAKRIPDVVLCGNCGTEDHDILECPSLCKKCGMRMSIHMGSLVNGQCDFGCICHDEPGHTRPACNRPCRPCIVENRDSNTKIKDCKKHCPLHLSLIDDERFHATCAQDHEFCPLCRGRHWHQDCPQWLKTLCLRRDCLSTNCNAHCHVCGGSNIDQIMSYFPKNDNVAYRQHVQGLVRTWHQYLDNSQWERVSFSNADIKQSTWSMLRCKHHACVTATVCSREEERVDTWKKVVNCVRGGFTDQTISKAVRLLQVPECPVCLYRQRQE